MYISNLKQVDFNRVTTLKELLDILKAMDYNIFIDVNKYPELEWLTFDEPSS
jgi:hypothetical protein